MKLMDKETGEIGTLLYKPDDEEEHFVVVTSSPATTRGYKTLAGLYNKWKDYEEPKEWYTINKFDGSIQEINDDTCAWTDEEKESIAELGFRFETKEEAEKAVEKLKAWKRLEDGGITFKNWTINQTGTIDCFATWGDNIPPSRKNPTLLEDLDLLFGGEK